MRNNRLAGPSAALLALGLCGSMLFAAEIVTKVEFPFKAGGISFPAGTYKIDTGQAHRRILLVRNVATGESHRLTFTTRLSQRTEKKAIVVFDHDGGNHYLTEVYPPGADGFELTGVPGSHTHVKVEGSK